MGCGHQGRDRCPATSGAREGVDEADNARAERLLGLTFPGNPQPRLGPPASGGR
jgi:hypothetical protein